MDEILPPLPVGRSPQKPDQLLSGNLYKASRTLTHFSSTFCFSVDESRSVGESRNGHKEPYNRYRPGLRASSPKLTAS
jgi:hypothetical protein